MTLDLRLPTGLAASARDFAVDGFGSERSNAMRGWMAAWAGLAIGMAGATAQEQPADAERADIAKTAAKLTAELKTPEARVLALHRFVRDDIRQVATQWG